MKKAFLVLSLLFFVNSFVFAQVAGNKIYGRKGYVTNSQLRRPVSSSGSLRIAGVRASASYSHRYYSIESNVLLSVKPDTFVAVFGFDRLGSTSKSSNDQVNKVFDKFTRDLEGLGISKGDVFVDFITQTTTTVEQSLAFHTKKTIAVRYKNRHLFEKIVTLAAKNSVFDLIKVDYIVTDFNQVRGQLFQLASKVIKTKFDNYTNLFGAKMAPKSLAVEKYGAFYPGERYVGYKRSFYYQPLNLAGFDSVVGSVGIEPVVQFTLYLRMDYDTEYKKKAGK